MVPHGLVINGFLLVSGREKYWRSIQIINIFSTSPLRLIQISRFPFISNTFPLPWTYFSLAFSLPTFYHNQRPASTFPYLVLYSAWPCERVMKKLEETKDETIPKLSDNKSSFWEWTIFISFGIKRKWKTKEMLTGKLFFSFTYFSPVNNRFLFIFSYFLSNNPGVNGKLISTMSAIELTTFR